jgi:hypothetical protein
MEVVVAKYSGNISSGKAKNGKRRYHKLTNRKCIECEETFESRDELRQCDKCKVKFAHVDTGGLDCNERYKHHAPN